MKLQKNGESCITLRCAGKVARMKQSRNAYTVLVGKPEIMRPLGDFGVEERIILN